MQVASGWKDHHRWGFDTSVDGQEEFDHIRGDIQGDWYHVAGCRCRAGSMVVYNISGISLIWGVGLPLALPVMKDCPCLEASMPLPFVILAMSIQPSTERLAEVVSLGLEI